MNKPRIITGKFKGFNMKVPAGSRPVTDIIKTQVFDSLDNTLILDSKVLDLFSGSGSFGLEALSRGASECTFVDISLESKRAIDLFINKFPQAKIIFHHIDVNTFLSNNRVYQDLIFIDPPFELFKDGYIEKLCLKIKECIVSGHSAIIILKCPNKQAENIILNDAFHLKKIIKSGATYLKIYSIEKP
jgi:16S rRNA (guanine966-N2)-methyltransferase